MLDSRALPTEKEIFMKSKLSWAPTVPKLDAHFINMPKKGVGKDKEQKTIEEASQTAIGSQRSRRQARKMMEDARKVQQ
jgi:hypothetical protein